LNERIKELAEHCDFYIGNEHYDKPHEEKQRLFMGKFAELIIKECCVSMRPMLRGMISRSHAIHLIKEHFGVKE